MRIIGGNARSRKFLAPKGLETRPTQDRVRESLFNIIHQKCAGAMVLDLFAGSGALGFEAASRGAGEITLIDFDKTVIGILHKNIDSLKLGVPVTVLKAHWQEGLVNFQKEQKKFDLIFIDPPYQMENQEEIFFQIAALKLLTGDGWIIYEHDGNHELEKLPANLERFDHRKYRDTFISFYRIKQEELYE